MWWKIINKIINNEKLSTEEEKKFDIFQKRFFTEEQREGIVVVFSNIKKGYLRNFLEKISQDTKEEQDKQIKAYLTKAIKYEGYKNIDEIKEVPITKISEDGEEYEDDEILRQENDSELSYYSKIMREAAEKAFDEAVEYVQAKDGRKGELKFINFETDEYILTEGDFARNFALFIPWRDSILKNRTDYTIGRYINYVKDITDGKLTLKNSTEDERFKNIWASTKGSLADIKSSCEDIKFFCSLFKILSSIKFFKRKPEILEETSFEEYVTRYLSDEVLK